MWTGSGCFPEQRHFGVTFRQKGRVPWGKPSCIDSILLVYRQYPFSEQKQREAKVKVKETDPTCSQIWLFPVTFLPKKLSFTSCSWDFFPYSRGLLTPLVLKLMEVKCRSKSARLLENSWGKKACSISFPPSPTSFFSPFFYFLSSFLFLVSFFSYYSFTWFVLFYFLQSIFYLYQFFFF